MAALKMFELGKLSSGKAAELAGVSRVEFFELCGRYQVPIVSYDEGELQDEVEFLAHGHRYSEPLLQQARELAKE